MGQLAVGRVYGQELRGHRGGRGRFQPDGSRPAGAFRQHCGEQLHNYENPAYDEAFANAKASVDEEEKTQYYKECERILAEDAANVYIQDLPSFVALNKKYGGYEFYPLYVQDISKLYLVDEQN